MSESNNYPFAMNDIERSTDQYIKKYFKGLRRYDTFVSVGPKGYLFPKTLGIREQLSSIYNMPVRPCDVFVATFPRSGTTVTQELVWLVLNNLDYNAASSVNLMERYTSMGSSFSINIDLMAARFNEFLDVNPKHLNILKKMITSPVDVLANTPDPRFIKSHIPISMLPPDVLKISKMVYVARDPRDVAVSLYHLSRLRVAYDFDGDFKTFWSFFVKGLLMRAPYFEQVKEAWALRDNPNMLFLFYEDISNDISTTIRKVSAFLGKQYNEEQIAKLSEHLKIDNFKRNKSVNRDFLKDFHALNLNAEPFVRKGKCGGWRDYFDEEMTKQAEIWIEDNLRDTDLRFP